MTLTAWALPPWPSGPTLSVILGTYNRIVALKKSLEGIRAAVGSLSYEIIVCDAGSTDGSREWLAGQSNVVLFGDWQLTGAVAAFNRGFALARGQYIATLNDDCLASPGCLEEGVKHLEANPKIGQVAFSLYAKDSWVVNQFRDCPWANYGIVRAELARKIAAISGGLWSPVYRTYGGDVELSCWVWRLGFKVQPLSQRVADLPEQDSLRRVNETTSRREAQLLYSRWPSEAAIRGNALPCVDDAMLQRLRELPCGST